MGNCTVQLINQITIVCNLHGPIVEFHTPFGKYGSAIADLLQYSGAMFNYKRKHYYFGFGYRYFHMTLSVFIEFCLIVLLLTRFIESKS